MFRLIYYRNEPYFKWRVAWWHEGLREWMHISRHKNENTAYARLRKLANDES